MSADKYPTIFWRQMRVIAHLLLLRVLHHCRVRMNLTICADKQAGCKFWAISADNTNPLDRLLSSSYKWKSSSHNVLKGITFMPFFLTHWTVPVIEKLHLWNGSGTNVKRDMRQILALRNCFWLLSKIMIHFQNFGYYDHEIDSLIQFQEVSSCLNRKRKITYRQSRNIVLHFKYLE